jgi:hypothetical protein
MTSGRDLSQGVKAHQVVNAQKLTERWRARMAEFTSRERPRHAARDCLARRRALVIDACTPMPDQDSGSVTALGLLHGLQALGFKVCFAPQSNMASSRATRKPCSAKASRRSTTATGTPIRT